MRGKIRKEIKRNWGLTPFLYKLGTVPNFLFFLLLLFLATNLLLAAPQSQTHEQSQVLKQEQTQNQEQCQTQDQASAQIQTQSQDKSQEQTEPQDQPQIQSESQPPQETPAQPEIPQILFPEGVKLIARTYEKAQDRIFASGNVEIHYKDVKLFADRIELNTETKDVLAEGNVVIQSPDEVVSAERILFNLDTRQGKFDQAYGMIQPTVFYEAESIERKSDNLYSLTDAKLTSCTQPVPRWKFTCSRANFKKDDYVEMWNSVFSIKKVPIFYLPYMRYPLDRERATGFLMPQAGYSGPKGFFYSQSFYLAIVRNMDATFNFDYYSARGMGGGLEYRYLFSGGTGGDARFYYFIFKPDPETGERPPSAYILRLNHNQPLPYGFSLVANVDYQASFDFLREFDNNVKRALISNRVSQVYLSRSWSYFNFSVRASQFETYFTQIDNSVITRYFPQIGLSSFKIKLFSAVPLYFSFSSSFSRWAYGWKTDFEADNQTKAQNISLRPALSMPFSKIPWLSLNTTFSPNFVYYTQSFAPNTRRVIDEPLLASNFILQTEALGPVIYRIYDVGPKGATRIKHIIEPYAVYYLETPVAYPERIITATGFFRYHQVSYGMTNRVIIKHDEMPREVFSWGIGQTYYLAPEEGPLSLFRVDGEIPRFSDVGSYVRFYPAGKVSLDFGAGYNTYKKLFSSLRLGANLNSPADPVFLSVNWFKSTNPWYKDVLGDRHQVGVFAGVKIPRLSLEAMGEVEFNITEQELLYSGASLIYHYQCLDFRADVKVFHFREKPEVQFRISFGLGNIGKTTDFLGGLRF